VIGTVVARALEIAVLRMFTTAMIYLPKTRALRITCDLEIPDDAGVCQVAVDAPVAVRICPEDGAAALDTLTEVVADLSADASVTLNACTTAVLRTLATCAVVRFPKYCAFRLATCAVEVVVWVVFKVGLSIRIGVSDELVSHD
jgi:hypothetical protein